MNKAFDKILERLKEIIKIEIQLHGGRCNGKTLALGYAKGIENAIEIVQEVAEEYTSTEHINCSTNTSTDTSNNDWIPCSERLPKERDWYLAVFEEVDTGFIGIPYIADYLMGSHTKFTTEDGWIIRNCSDREDESAEYYKNLRCVAWQPLPQPYKESENL